MKLLSILAAGVLLGGCASSGMQDPAPRAPAATPTPAVTPAPVVEPVGVWEYTAEAQGQTLGGTIELTRVDGTWGGLITNTALPNSTVTGVNVQGSMVTVVANSPQGEVTIHMTVTGNQFAGTWSVGGESGPIRGSRR